MLSLTIAYAKHLHECFRVVFFFLSAYFYLLLNVGLFHSFQFLSVCSGPHPILTGNLLDVIMPSLLRSTNTVFALSWPPYC